jgi:hypothetical protein
MRDLLSAVVLDAVVVHPRRRALRQLALVTSSPEVLERLAVDPAPEVRAAVAQSDHIVEALLRELASDSRTEVRGGSRDRRVNSAGGHRRRPFLVAVWSTAPVRWAPHHARPRTNGCAP